MGISSIVFEAATATASHGYHQPTTLEEVRSLWIGNLQYWVDESYLHSSFAHTGETLGNLLNFTLLTGTSVNINYKIDLTEVS
ncbi:polyadenylate-binding protein RBP47B' [Canna indica]|uniref:Polyadenylate-binding protein RBP47B n=1 Tax=Canna indica TaxID=4628 RepID=A0AAQ3JX32_9LILI|nr:polyadenylate-binding protein RBP47B' [Canna indica]